MNINKIGKYKKKLKSEFFLHFLHKHIKNPDQNEAIRSCRKHEFFTFDYNDACENIQSLETQLNHKSFFNFEA